MKIIDDRRALHRIPELELDLPKTMEYLRKALEGLNCQVLTPVGCAVCAFFDFGKDSAIAFRADMDALPIAEPQNKTYASTHEGKMHACGHDGHMAILLELARRLSNEKELPHNVLLVFQPGEESPGGAKGICESGVLTKFGVKAIFGLHLWPGLEEGKVFCRENEMMSHASEINVDIYGRSAHIAKYQEAVDAMAAAMEFLRQAEQMEKSLPEGIYRLLKFGRMTSGTVRNAISDHSRIEGSLRAFQDDIFDHMVTQLDAIAQCISQQFGCRVEINRSEGYPAVMNPPALYKKVAQLLPLADPGDPSMTAEDFSHYQQQVPGIFFWLGLGDVAPLHNENFDFDESILVKGADFFMELAKKFQ